LSLIELKELRKSYNGVEAVHGVSFAAETGSVLGLLGPNGAGKTTIMKVLTGYHFPSSGTALVDGVDVAEDPLAVKRRVGYLPESVPLYQDLTVAEYLDFAADARGLEAGRRAGGARAAAIERAIASCGLAGVYRKRVEELSKGYRQRLGLAQAILHDPPILILDEPTTGLDPNQIIEIRELIRSLGESKTVILSTHILQEVEAICSTVIILNEGRIAAQGAPSEIGEALKGEERIRVRVKPGARELGRESLSGIPGLRSVASFEAEPSGIFAAEIIMPPALARIPMRAEGAAAPSAVAGHSTSTEAGEAVFDWAVANGAKILELERRRLSLEEIFVKLTSEGEGR
jgi:ABC-2 type transport system ATP-binding protein